MVKLILPRLPATLLLMFASSASPCRRRRARRRRGTPAAVAGDSVISVFALLGYATPLFWLGLMLIVLFSVKLGLLPAAA